MLIDFFFLQCLVIEDSPVGVQGALAASMQVLMVPANYIPKEQRDKATLTLMSLNDFKPEFFGLPPYDNWNVAQADSSVDVEAKKINK